MALQASTFFSAFDVTDGSQERDISNILSKALYFDVNALSAVNVAFDSPVTDTTYYWNDDVLNGDTTTTGASAASDGTTLTVASGHGIHEGDLLYQTSLAGSTEVMQTTATGATAVTVTRAYNSTTAASIASGATLGIIRAEQESSDIGTDKTLNVTVRNNFTHIWSTYDLAISGSQLARKMATDALADYFAHQLANRAIEFKINLTRGLLYSEKSASAGSDSVYRTMAGMRNWIRDNSGVTDTDAEAFAYSVINAQNKTVVDRGDQIDTLLIGTDLVGSVAGIDSSVRRLRESDKQVGYTVQEILLNQGNMVRVVVDARVKTGDAFGFNSQKVTLKPLEGRGMFVKQAPELKDGKRARILGEWTLEFRNPNTGIYWGAKT